MINNINKVCFFNHWHNGDIFACKGHIRNLIEQLKAMSSFEFIVAHPKSHKLLLDLDARYERITDHYSDPSKPYFIIPSQNNIKSVFIVDDTLYINTWIGAYREVFALGEEHANWINLNRMWNIIYHNVANLLGITIASRFNPIAFIPSTIWEKYETDHAKKFVEGRGKIVLVCNGVVTSSQSAYQNVENMDNVINSLAKLNPDVDFVCTSQCNAHHENIYFTDNIFSGVTDGDLNEIAYLSTFCDLIIGKNSGPYMYCHVRDNIFRENCTFVSLSDRASDSYAYCCPEISCNYYHYTGKDDDTVISLVNKILIKDFPKHNNFVTLPTYAI